MAVNTYKGSVMTGLTAATPSLATPGKAGGRLHYWGDTVEVAASDATSTISMARIPSNAIISGGMSKVFFDDLASSGAPTLDIGIFAIRSGDVTDNDDALNDGIDLATAAGSASLIKDIANYGKRLWEIAGLTSDPKCDLEIKATIKDAATNATGTVSWEIVYSCD